MDSEPLSDPCNFAMKHRLYYSLKLPYLTISNKESFKPSGYKGDPPYTIAGWERGYSWDRFWSNCHFLLGEIANIEGIQQLCHHYYLQNGSLGATTTVNRIKKLRWFNKD